MRVRNLACGLLLVLFEPVTQVNAQVNAQDDGPLVMRAALSHAAYSESYPGTLALRISYAVAADVPRDDRPPLNLALVIDRSGSMAKQGKFEHAMQAARLVVENLSDHDVVSIVAFNQDSIVLSAAGPAVNKEFLDHRLDEIKPQGWTNLSAGLLEAIAQIDSQASDVQIKRAIVLTDGRANRGVTDPRALARLVESARRRGIGVSTMGCGEEFDEKVLRALAASGGGRYAYVRTSEDIPDAMAAELNGLLRVVAQNVTVEVRTGESLNITEVQGKLLEQPTGTYTFDLGDIRQDEHGVLLLRVAPHEFLAGEVVNIDCTMSFDRPDLAVRDEFVVRVETVALKDLDKTLIRQSADQTVILYADMVDAVERAEEAVLGLDEDGFRVAVRLFEHRHEAARRHGIEARDQPLLNQAFMLKHFMKELSEAAEAGLMHGHEDERRALSRDVEYRRYLREHHSDSH
jgi:Ca-activated chloride channel family protein